LTSFLCSRATEASTDETWEWPNERFLQRAPALAAKIAYLIADESKWVDRRVETVSFVDENTRPPRPLCLGRGTTGTMAPIAYTKATSLQANSTPVLAP
jgi:hypothetical protein